MQVCTILQVNDGNSLCGSTRWKAAKAVSRTMNSLDECGLEVAGCRHGFGLKALNMFRGEMYEKHLHTPTYFYVCWWSVYMSISVSYWVSELLLNF